jgi:hypothetical protein
MTWESFYLVCFLVGLLLSALSLLGGLGHIGWHIHVPHAPHIPTSVHIPTAYRMQGICRTARIRAVQEALFPGGMHSPSWFFFAGLAQPAICSPATAALSPES